MKYTKPALDISGQLSELTNDGLVINNTAAAEHFLNNVSYFRFAPYLRIFEDISSPRHFKQGATFEQAAMIYSFDVELRSLLFSAIQKIEMLLQIKWLKNTNIANDRSYAIFCCLAYWLNAVNNTNTFKSDLKKLLAKYPSVDSSAMGFPIGWKREPLWR